MNTLPRLKIAGFAIAAMLPATFVSAADVNYIWTGAGANNLFSTTANWNPVGKPNFGDFWTFPDDVLVTQRTMDMNQSLTGLKNLQFLSAGYDIIDVGDVGSSIRYDGGPIISQGAGVNHFGAIFNLNTNSNVTVGTGNTLYFSNFINNGAITIDGPGTLVVDGADQLTANFNASLSITDPSATLIANSIIRASGTTLTQGTLMGNGGFIAYQYGTTHFAGVTFAPGGNGVYGSEIGAFTFMSGSDTIYHNLSLESGTLVNMQIGNSLGENDMVFLDLTSSANGHMTIGSGVTLDIQTTGDGSVVAGTYTLFENTDATNIVGTFDTVTLNGVFNPDVTVNYNGTNITVDLPAIVPEPSFYAMLAGLAVMGITILRRRRA